MSEQKPKILVCVICRNERDGWVNPTLCGQLLELQTLSSWCELTVKMANHPWRVEYARNKCIADAREMGADYCVQIDNDMVLPPGFADILHDAHESQLSVVCLAYGHYHGNKLGYRILPDDYGVLCPNRNFRATGSGCGGVMIIASHVWEYIPGPWFRWLVNDDELQTRKIHEDNYFTELVNSHGFQVVQHEYELAGHLKTVNVTKTAYELNEAKKDLEKSKQVYTRNPPPIIGRPGRAAEGIRPIIGDVE